MMHQVNFGCFGSSRLDCWYAKKTKICLSMLIGPTCVPWPADCVESEERLIALLRTCETTTWSFILFTGVIWNLLGQKKSVLGPSCGVFALQTPQRRLSASQHIVFLPGANTTSGYPSNSAPLTLSRPRPVHLHAPVDRQRR